MRRRYKEVFIGGPLHGQVNHQAVPAGLREIQVQHMPKFDIIKQGPVDYAAPFEFDRSVYYQHILGLGRERQLTFWVHEELFHTNTADQAVLDFLCFPFEI